MYRVRVVLKLPVKVLLFVFLLFPNVSVFSQILITDKNSSIWAFSDGHTYEFEWTHEVSEDKFYTDTIYTIENFPKQNEWKIYFDAGKTKIATLMHYDTLLKTVKTQHFNRRGQLIKELLAHYSNRKKYNPAVIRVSDVLYLKTFRNDSLIYKITGYTNSLLLEYNNYLSKRHFEKRIFYTAGKNRDEETGEIRRDYYNTGKLKSICGSYIKQEMDREGNEYSVKIYNCENFDEKGCLKSEGDN